MVGGILREWLEEGDGERKGMVGGWEWWEDGNGGRKGMKGGMDMWEKLHMGMVLGWEIWVVGKTRYLWQVLI